MQTKLFSLMANRTEKMDIEVKNKNKDFTVSVDRAKVKFKIITSPNKPPVLKMNMMINGIVEESTFEMSPAQLDTYGKVTAKHTKKEALKFLKHLQKENTDPLGFPCVIEQPE